MQPKPNLQEKLAHIARLVFKGDLRLAEPAARQLLAAYPRRSEAQHALGRVLLLGGRPELAEDHLRRAAGTDKGNVLCRLDLGQCLLAMGRTEEAEREIRAEIAASPFRSRYIVLLSQVNQSAEVLALLESELARPGLHVMARSDLMLRRGSLRAKEGQHAETIARLAGPYPRAFL